MVKFTKNQSYYSGIGRTQIGRCKNCVWFRAQKFCELVSEEGEPTIGIISPDGVCGLYEALPMRIRSYEILYGRGEGESGIAPQILRKKVIKKARVWGGPYNG